MNPQAIGVLAIGRRGWVEGYSALPPALEATAQGRYALDDLKAAFGAALEADDDVLTQFHEPEELRAKLAAATSFADVAAVLELSRSDTDAA